jgi:hypothetical protein
LRLKTRIKSIRVNTLLNLNVIGNFIDLRFINKYKIYYRRKINPYNLKKLEEEISLRIKKNNTNIDKDIKLLKKFKLRYN